MRSTFAASALVASQTAAILSSQSPPTAKVVESKPRPALDKETLIAFIDEALGIVEGVDSSAGL